MLYIFFTTIKKKSSIMRSQTQRGRNKLTLKETDMCYINFETVLIVNEDINICYQEKDEVLVASAPKSFPATAGCEGKSLFFSHFHALGFLQDIALDQSPQASHLLLALPAASFLRGCTVTCFYFFHVFVAVYHLCCSVLNEEGLHPLPTPKSLAQNESTKGVPEDGSSLPWGITTMEDLVPSCLI